MFGGRAALALVTLVILVLNPVTYGPHTELYAAIAIAIVVWSLILAVSARRPAPAQRPRRLLLLVDGAAILAANMVDGGPRGPWYAVSLVTLMPVALYFGTRAAVAYAVALAVTLAAGGPAVNVLRLDLAGPGPDPLELPLMCLTLAATCAIAVGVGWAFDRLSEATASYDATMAELVELERRAAATAAREETRRELHSDLCHSIYAAAIAHDGIAKRVPEDPALDALGVKLRAANAALAELMDSLRA